MLQDRARRLRGHEGLGVDPRREPWTMLSARMDAIESSPEGARQARVHGRSEGAASISVRRSRSKSVPSCSSSSTSPTDRPRTTAIVSRTPMPGERGKKVQDHGPIVDREQVLVGDKGQREQCTPPPARTTPSAACSVEPDGWTLRHATPGRIHRLPASPVCGESLSRRRPMPDDAGPFRRDSSITMTVLPWVRTISSNDPVPRKGDLS